MNKFILPAVFLLFFPVKGFSSQSFDNNHRINVKTSVDKHTLTIGDKLRYTITIEYPKNIEIQPPEFGNNLGGLAIRDFGSSEKVWWNKKIYKQWYILDTYSCGSYTIPEARINYRKKGENKWHALNTKKINIEVKSLLNKDKNPSDIRDIAPPATLPTRLFLYLITLLIILGVCGAAFWLNYKKKNKHQEEKMPKRSAYEIAYEALNLLEKKNYISRGEIKAYYVELSDIVRHYLENRFNIRAPEMTTEEFLNYAKKDKKLSRKHKSLLRQFLYHCDLVKFAKYNPNIEEIKLSFNSAKNLIDETKEEMVER